MIKKGTDSVVKMFIGSAEVAKAYIGSDLVYEKAAAGPTVNVYNRSYSIAASSASKLLYYYPCTFKVGATYEISVDCTGLRKEYIRISIQSNGQSGNKYVDTFTYTTTVTVNPNPNRMGVYFNSGCNAGTLYVTITETIPNN